MRIPSGKRKGCVYVGVRVDPHIFEFESGTGKGKEPLKLIRSWTKQRGWVGADSLEAKHAYLFLRGIMNWSKKISA